MWSCLLSSLLLLSLVLAPGPSLLLAQELAQAQAPAQGKATEYGPELPSVERLPIPDPTRLTSQALREAILALKDVIYTRLEGMDKALQLLQARSDRFPSELEAKIASVRDLLGERFKGIELQFEGIQLQFKERDTRVEQTARDSKTAVDAALQAAKEAVEKQNAASSQAAQKSEGAFTKSIEQLNELFRTSARSLEDKLGIAIKVSDDKLTAINERITRIEAIAVGSRMSTTDTKDSSMLLLAIVGAVVGVGGIVMAVVSTTRRPQP